ncbi:MAG: prepilin peptidase [Pirellulaceae bacterium]|nr:prepilin peptidase [Pirellulaceae bacterium]
MLSSELIPFAVVSLVSLIACVTDVRSFRIPNTITVPLGVSGIVYHGIVYGVAGLQNSILGFLFGGLVLILLYLIGGMGAGDVKLLAASGAWLGIPVIVYVFIVAATLGSLYSLGVLVSQGRLISAVTTIQVAFHQLVALGRHLGTEERVEAIVEQGDRHKRLLPFAVMIAIGVIVTMIGVYLV